MDTTAKKRILIMEDEKFLRDLYVQILKEEGYEVTEAADGEEGYRHLHEGGFDLILMDIMLPKMTGLDIMKKLKDDPVLKPNGKIIFLTNLNQDIDINEGVAFGVSGCLIKSDYTPDQIIKQVKGFLIN